MESNWRNRPGPDRYLTGTEKSLDFGADDASDYERLQWGLFWKLRGSGRCSVFDAV